MILYPIEGTKDNETRRLLIREQDVFKSLANWPELCEALLALTRVDFHGNE